MVLGGSPRPHSGGESLSASLSASLSSGLGATGSSFGAGSSGGRWRARARLEDQRQAVVRSAASDAGLSEDEVLRLRSKSPEDDAAVSSLLSDLEAHRAFEPSSACSQGGVSAVLGARVLTPSFLAVLEEASGTAKSAPAELGEDIAEAVARRLANSSSSRYVHEATATWPSYASLCQGHGLQARIHLAPSGLVTYNLGPDTAPRERPLAPRERPATPATLPAGSYTRRFGWELSGEGCWQVLPPDGPPTEVVLEMRQGFEWSAAGVRDAGGGAREPPRTLRVDLRECFRVSVGDAQDSEDEESYDEEEEEEEDEDAVDNG